MKSPDETTLFTTSGMQKRKLQFSDPTMGRTTLCDSQRCLRLNDLDEIGDGTHFLDFYMLGLFSFRHWSMKEGVDFWMRFLTSINVLPDTVTIHPDMQHHRHLYKDYDVTILEDDECIWSDGNIGGYCTEFYKNGVEIGNIVNPNGDSLDCGFGLERVSSFIPNFQVEEPTKGNVLVRTIELLISEGIVPSNTKHGYVLRKLIRKCFKEGIVLFDSTVVSDEHIKYLRVIRDIPKILKKFPDKTPEFYYDTFGIDKELLVDFLVK